MNVCLLLRHAGENKPTQSKHPYLICIYINNCYDVKNDQTNSFNIVLTMPYLENIN